jgi:hypothetical protein
VEEARANSAKAIEMKWVISRNEYRWRLLEAEKYFLYAKICARNEKKKAVVFTAVYREAKKRRENHHRRKVCNGNRKGVCTTSEKIL